jgi:hypothetical protein
MNHRPIALAVFSLALGCSSSSSTPSSTPPPAQTSAEETAFWTAFHAGDYAASADVAAALQKVYDADPKNERNTEMLGLTHVWRGAESSRDGVDTNAVIGVSGPAAARFLGEVHGMDAKNTFVTGFLGVTQWDFGTLQNNPGMQAQGRALLDQATAEDPVFGGFLEMFAVRLLPPSDPRVQPGLDAQWNAYELCTGAHFDRKNPNLQPLLDLAKNPSPRAFCWNSAKAPHAAEGVMTIMADSLVKSGQIDGATALYRAAQKVDSYAGWSFKAVVGDRLGADLKARAAGYADPDPRKWPTLGDPQHGCAFCHQT